MASCAWGRNDGLRIQHHDAVNNRKGISAYWQTWCALRLIFHEIETQAMGAAMNFSRTLSARHRRHRS